MECNFTKILIESNEDLIVHPKVLLAIKEDLNKSKDVIGNLDPREFAMFKRDDNFNYLLSKKIRYKFADDLSQSVITNAWLKTIELINNFEPLKKDVNNTVFLNGELPGDSILAFSFFALKKELNFTWIASSYLPENNIGGTHLGDKYGIFKNNRSKWLMSETNDGDMQNIENFLFYEALLKNNKVDVYISDAAMDTTCDPNNQELLNSKLHLGIALCGLLTLQTKGTMILKQFTFLEPITISLICTYATLFDEFYINKSYASRDTNSEVYLVGTGYKGLSSPKRKVLVNKLTNYDTSPLNLGTKKIKSYLPSIYQANEIFNEKQIKALEKQAIRFNKWKCNKKQYAKMRQITNNQICECWIEKNGM